MTTDSNVDQADSSTEDSASPSTCGPAETARRAPRVGSACLLNDRLFHVVDIGAGFRITLRDAETGQLSEAPLDDLVCLRAAGEGESTASEGAQALKRLTAVRQLLEQATITSPDYKRVAHELSVTPRTVQRLVKRAREEDAYSACEPRVRGVKSGSRQLPQQVDALVEEVIVRELQGGNADITLSKIYALIKTECESGLRLPAPGQTTVHRRFMELKKRPELLPKEAREALEEKQTAIKAHYRADHPLQIVQMDHTLVDVMCVDESQRKAVGRPWLTLVIDLYTRCILGFHLGFDAPSSLVTALCLAHAVLPKDEWLEEIGACGPWPMHGLIECLHTDNGADFWARALQLGCNKYRIARIFRRVGAPNMGGVIERMNRTLVTRQQSLPGATFSRTLNRRPKNVETSAALTLRELQCVMANEIARYHSERHSSLGMTPAAAWRQAFMNRSPPRLPADPHEFLMDFLPQTQRVITRNGINLFGLEYWDSALADQVRSRQKRIWRYDPRDITTIFLQQEDGSYLPVRLRDSRLPPISLYEWKLIKKRRAQEPGHSTDFDAVAKLISTNNEIVDEAKTKRDRRLRERRSAWRSQRKPLAEDAAASRTAEHTKRELIVAPIASFSFWSQKS